MKHLPAIPTGHNRAASGRYRGRAKKEPPPPFEFEDIGDEYYLSSAERPAISITARPGDEGGMREATLDFYVTLFDQKGKSFETHSLGRRSPPNSGVTVTRPDLESGTMFSLQLKTVESRRVNVLYLHSELIVGSPEALPQGMPSAFTMTSANGSTHNLCNGSTRIPVGHHSHLVLRLLSPGVWAATQIWLPLPDGRKQRLAELDAMTRKLFNGWKPRPTRKAGGYLKGANSGSICPEDPNDPYADCDTQSSETSEEEALRNPILPTDQSIARRLRPRVVRERQLQYSTGRSAKRGAVTVWDPHGHNRRRSGDDDVLEDNEEEMSSASDDLQLKLPMYGASTLVRYESQCYNVGTAKRALKLHAAKQKMQYLKEQQLGAFPTPLGHQPEELIDDLESSSPIPDASLTTPLSEVGHQDSGRRILRNAVTPAISDVDGSAAPTAGSSNPTDGAGGGEADRRRMSLVPRPTPKKPPSRPSLSIPNPLPETAVRRKSREALRSSILSGVSLAPAPPPLPPPPPPQPPAATAAPPTTREFLGTRTQARPVLAKAPASAGRGRTRRQPADPLARFGGAQVQAWLNRLLKQSATLLPNLAGSP